MPLSFDFLRYEAYSRRLAPYDERSALFMKRHIVSANIAAAHFPFILPAMVGLASKPWLALLLILLATARLRYLNQSKRAKALLAQS